MSQIASASSRRRQPSIVSKIIDRGTYSYVGIIGDSPAQVLKWPRPDPDALASFEWERRNLALLGSNPHIVNLLWESESGLCFDYHPFRSMRHYYAQNGLASIDQRYRWCHQVVSGFSYIHSKGMIHHDISARNILISSNLTVKICDFGSATLLGERVHGSAEFRYSLGRHEAEGTFEYDLFCMGALFYEIILGKPPYEKLSRTEVVQQYSERNFPSLDAIEPAYGIIIDNCWHDKYASIQQLETDLPVLFNSA